MREADGGRRPSARASMSSGCVFASRSVAIGLAVNCLTAAWLASSTAAVQAQDGVDFKGKTVTIIASFEAGGPYDLYSRLIARHIGAHLPGRPNVVVQNM